MGAAIFEADTESFLRNPELAAEVFGPATLIVRHSTRAQVLELARNLGGHLTATIHGTEADLHEFSDLIAILKDKVGRLVFNGFPTGVEVSHAMVHGGPYPVDLRWTLDVGRQPGDFPFLPAGVLSGISRIHSARRTARQQPFGYLANGGRRNDQRIADRHLVYS